MKTFILILGFIYSVGWAGEYEKPATDSIKSLTEKQIEDLLSGQGMGMAKAAELNQYPRPQTCS